MNYSTEPWYKLFIRESTEDKLLPILNRALRDFLLRLAKSRDDGTVLGRTDNPARDLARALGAHPGEEEQIAAFIATMLEDGYLSHKRGRLWITNFEVAQSAKSPGAKRQLKWRGKSNGSHGETLAQEERDVTQPSQRDVSVASRETSPKIRGEERREEKNHQSARAREAPAVVVLASSESEPDPGEPKPCPWDLVQKLEVLETAKHLAEKLQIPIESVRHELRQFEAYWTIGQGAMKKRTNWPGKARQWVIEQAAKPGGLKAPGAIQHAQHAGNGRGYTPPDDGLEALVASIGRAH